MDTREVRMSFSATCPRCAEGPHEGELVATLVRGTLLFGGPGKRGSTAMATVTVSCPTTGRTFESTVAVPAEDGERVDAVRLVPPSGDEDDVAAPPGGPAGEGDVAQRPAASTAVPAAHATPDPAEADWRLGELAEWRKNSITVARDAAAKLLAAGTAAIGAYFAILKVVTGDTVAAQDRLLAVAPAFAYLLSTVLAAVALLPILRRVFDPEEFERFREERLTSLNRLIVASTSVFVLATGLAALAYAVLL